MIRKRRTVIGMTFLCLAALGAKGKKDWYNHTPYRDWTSKQVGTMLSRSPWTQTFTHVTSNTQEIVAGAAGSPGEIGVDTSEHTRYHFRFHWLSAKPVRMAFARLVQEANPQMEIEQLERFEEQELEDAVLALRIESKPPGSPMIRQIEESFRTLSVERLTQDTYLTTKRNKRVPLKEFRPPEGNGLGARFIFPRTLDDGSPLFTEADSEIRLTTKLTIPESNLRIRLKYKSKDMLFQGHLEY